MERNLPPIIISVLSGSGHGKPGVKQLPLPPGKAPQINEQNRHIQSRALPREAAPAKAGRAQQKQRSEARPVASKLSKEEAVKNAMSNLSQAGEREEISGDGLGGGRGRDRGRGRGLGRGRGKIECVEWKWRTWTKYSAQVCIWETMLSGGRWLRKLELRI